MENIFFLLLVKNIQNFKGSSDEEIETLLTIIHEVEPHLSEKAFDLAMQCRPTATMKAAWIVLITTKGDEQIVNFYENEVPKEDPYWSTLFYDLVKQLKPRLKKRILVPSY